MVPSWTHSHLGQSFFQLVDKLFHLIYLIILFMETLKKIIPKLTYVFQSTRVNIMGIMVKRIVIKKMGTIHSSPPKICLSSSKWKYGRWNNCALFHRLLQECFITMCITSPLYMNHLVMFNFLSFSIKSWMSLLSNQSISNYIAKFGLNLTKTWKKAKLLLYQLE